MPWPPGASGDPAADRHAGWSPKGKTAPVPVEIRDPVPDDLDALRGVFRRSSLSNEGDREALLAHPEALELELPEPADGVVRVGQLEGRVAGFATARLRPGGPVELVDLFVDPSWMRRGVGRALVADVQAMAHARGTSVVVVANPHALAFYERVGFVAEGQAETEFGPGIKMRISGRPREVGDRGTAAFDELG
jgi:ribosomal protein S18 acetylase RimI-like enzyme